MRGAPSLSLGLSGHFTHLRGGLRGGNLRVARTGISRTCVVAPRVKMSFESGWAAIEAGERTGRFATFGVHRASDFVGKRELSGPLDVSMRSDCVEVVDEPYWHTSVEEIIANFGVLCQTAHPVGPDRKGGTGRIVDVRLYIHNIVQERQNVEAVLLSLSHEDDDVAKGEGMVEKQHDVMFQGLEHLTGDVLLIPTRVLPLLIAV